MCYLLHQRQPEAEPSGTGVPPSLGRVRPRWIGAAVATLIGSLAVAAGLGVPLWTSPPPSAKAVAAPAAPAVPTPLASRSISLPIVPVVEQTSGPVVDDGVPTSSDVAKAGMGDCHHGL
jgi:hypothetical protein